MAILDNLIAEFSFDVPNPIAGTNVIANTIVQSSFITVGTRRYFQPQDNLRLVAVGAFMPYCFNTANDTFLTGDFQIGWREKTTGTTAGVPEVSSGGDAILLPFTNSFMPMPDADGQGLFIPWASGNSFSNPTEFYLSGVGFDISLIGVPDSLAGTTQRCSIFLRVLHNLELVT